MSFVCRIWTLLRESGQFEGWEGDGKRKGGTLADMMETRKVGVLCVCV